MQEFEKYDDNEKKLLNTLSVPTTENGIKDAIKHKERYKKYAIPFAIAAAGVTAGCGLLTDYLRNKKAKENADYVKQVGMKQALVTNSELAVAESGRPYTKINTGVKYGAPLGAACGIAHARMSFGKLNNIANTIACMFTFMLGGLLMGAIADSAANKSARKNA